MVHDTCTSRRRFLRKATGGALAHFTATQLLAQEAAARPRPFLFCLYPGSLGVRADQAETIRLAKFYGFEAVEAMPKAWEDPEAVAAEVKANGLVWGTAGLPVEFRRGAAVFEEGLAELPAIAARLQQAGVERMSTWLMPSHDAWTYLTNFDQHANRLRRVATILKDHGVKLGLEYVGTRSLLVRGRYPFIHTLAETRELIARIGTGNVGVVLDSWHWWTAGDTLDAIRELSADDIILVDLNDAPQGVAKEDQLDNRRQLPGSTGVIPMAGFVRTLAALGYDGPVRAEPFNQTLHDLENDAACEATIRALRQTWSKAHG